ncbi:hypothetical protein LCGC14_0616250 [marine sediment metagenome]|uniref:Major facilitator superfamily (MFS) profile domain-containing protein n=1 Tax=marine sediment metagenome TaxID=412755 RepID=A0A0F9RQF0_9ZZZZ|nr:MAG: Major Facilitator Superfamily protein [Candidatus Lokiarchaeum sp. GC14_75]
MILSKKSAILLLISVFLTSTVAMFVYTYVPKYILNLGLERPLMQLLVSIFPLTAFIFPPLFGFYSDKLQKRRVFIISGAIGISCAFIMLSLTKNLILIVILIFLFGLFMALSNISFALYTELVEDDKKLISYYNATIVAGWFTGAQSGGIYIDLFGIDNIFIILFLISLLTILFVVFIKENRSLILERYRIIDDNNLSTQKKIYPLEEKQISKSIYFGLFFRNFSIKPIMPILAIIMSFYLSGDTEIGFLIGLNFFLQFFQMLAAGKIITKKNIKSFMIIGYFLSAITIFGFIIASNFWMFFFFQILFSFSYSMHWAATIVYITQKTTPKNKGQILGYANASVFSGSFIGSLFFSLLLVFNPDYYIAMYFMLLFPIISVVIIFLKLK